MFSLNVRLALLCLVAVLCDFAATVEDEGRIVGGQETTIDKVPYLIQLRDFYNNFFCGGTLISRRHVVTAAHCLKKRDYRKILVVANATSIDEFGIQRTIDKAYMHPSYDVEKAETYDVAVLKLNAEILSPHIRPLALPEKSLTDRDRIQVSGWGLTSEYSAGPAYKVRTVSVPVFTDDQCVRQYGSRMISHSMFCASVPGSLDACSGDSGGPAVANGALAGIVSWGYGCARFESPGVYTDVKTVLPFIDYCMTL